MNQSSPRPVVRSSLSRSVLAGAATLLIGACAVGVPEKQSFDGPSSESGGAAGDSSNAAGNPGDLGQSGSAADSVGGIGGASGGDAAHGGGAGMPGAGSSGAGGDSGGSAGSTGGGKDGDGGQHAGAGGSGGSGGGAAGKGGAGGSKGGASNGGSSASGGTGNAAGTAGSKATGGNGGVAGSGPEPFGGVGGDPGTGGDSTGGGGSPVDVPSITCVTSKDGTDAALSCPSGQYIVKIQFASYGTPIGSCTSSGGAGGGGGAGGSGGAPLSYGADPACHSAGEIDAINTVCLNKGSCTFPVNAASFGTPGPGCSAMAGIGIAVVAECASCESVGQLDCFSGCVPKDDPNNCGACFNTCNAGSCVGGSCTCDNAKCADYCTQNCADPGGSCTGSTGDCVCDDPFCGP